MCEPRRVRVDWPGLMLVELSVVEQRYHAVMEVLVSGGPVVEVAERYRMSRELTAGVGGAPHYDPRATARSSDVQTNEDDHTVAARCPDQHAARLVSTAGVGVLASALSRTHNAIRQSVRLLIPY
jgi:hypothetical protein